jgi:hypothetical protein
VSETAVRVRIEVILLAVDDQRLTFRAVHHPLDGGDEPDDVARTAAGLATGSAPTLLHSTSWRHDDGHVVLTYVALPDPDPGAVRFPVGATIEQGEDGADPSPDVDLADVAAHACRHLAFLDRTDAEVSAALVDQRELRGLVRGFAPDVAGEASDDHGGRVSAE